MAIPRCAPALEHYLASLRSRYEVQPEENGCYLATPFFLPDNSRLGVHLVERADGSLEVTDHGETVDGLFTSGVTIPPDDKRLVTIGRRFGVEVEGGEISRRGEVGQLDEAITAVIHAVLDMAYLVYTRQTRALATFEKAFEHLLIDRNRSYERHFEVDGFSDSYTFDYRLISHRAPVLVETLSATSRQRYTEQARLTSFKVSDTKRLTGDAGYEFVCLIDDRTRSQQEAISERALKPLREYLDAVVFWSERERVEALVAA
jgi:hypothetical protein